MLIVRLLAVLAYAALVAGFLALTTAAAHAEPTCTSAFGQTACGYQCEAAYGEVRCAQTPWGACKAAYGKIVCSDGRQDLQWRGVAVPRAECKAAYGEVACGWSCEAAFGELACAQTPEGTCAAGSGGVTCFDPQGVQAPVASPAPATASPTCESAYGQTACGYDCTAAYGQIACAQTPQGTCEAAYGKVTCWDPPTPAVGSPILIVPTGRGPGPRRLR